MRENVSKLNFCTKVCKHTLISILSASSLAPFEVLSTLELSSVLGILHSVGAIDLSSKRSSFWVSLLISLGFSLVRVSEPLLSTTFSTLSLSLPVKVFLQKSESHRKLLLNVGNTNFTKILN